MATANLNFGINGQEAKCTINGIGKSRKYCTRRSSNFQTASLLHNNNARQTVKNESIVSEKYGK
jgi:hypothetical protein